MFDFILMLNIHLIYVRDLDFLSLTELSVYISTVNLMSQAFHLLNLVCIN